MTMTTEPENIETAEMEVIPPGALEAVTRGEIDVQISTAKKYPRSLQRFKDIATSMATLDADTAQSCLYSRPVGKDPKTGKQVYAEGLSIRLAEIVGASYGNIRVGSMITEMTPQYVKARGFAHDLETNFASTSEVVESTVDKYGKPYSARMRVVVAKAALAKARRDATFQVVPKALCKPIELKVRKLLLGDAKSVADSRKDAMAWIKTLGIPKERVFLALGISGENDLNIPMLATLAGLRTALNDSEITIDEAFPSAPPPSATIPNFEKETPPVPENNAQEGGENNSGNSEPSGTGVDHEVTLQKRLSYALLDLDFKEDRFVSGLRMLDVQGIAKQAKTAADLSDAVCERIFEEGLDDILASIETAESKKK